MQELYHCLHEDRKRPACIHCGRCLEVCPLFAATGREEFSPRAKFHLLGNTPEALAGVDVARLAEMCLACGKCEKACPQNLCAPDLIAKLREIHPTWREWVWKRWLRGATVLWPAASAAARTVPGVAARGPLGGLRALKAAPEKRLAPWLSVDEYDEVGAGEKVLIFAGCTAKNLRPSWIAKAEAVLGGLGFEPITGVDLACCGCTLGHAGLKDEQRRMRTVNMMAWREAGRPRLVTFCATCRCGLRSYADVDLGWAADEPQKWRESVVSLSSLLGDTSFSVAETAPERVFYHKPCHGAGNDTDAAFLARVLGPRLVATISDSCCGFGGVMQVGAPKLSAQVAGHYWSRAGLAPGDQLLTGCSGCVLQLSATAPKGVRVGHWLDVLDPSPPVPAAAAETAETAEPAEPEGSEAE